MDLLWKKEPNSGLYVNLFKGVDAADQHESKEVVNKIKNNKKHKLLAKNNEKSSEFRSTGNDWFKKKDWEKAMSWYNKSLCFAENGSENISLAYANRSSCFMHLEKYAKCLEDINLAVQANYPERLMPKLLKRQKDCVESIENGAVDNSESHCPSLDYEEDSRFPGMANVLEIKKNNQFGRLIVAQCDIPAGKTVIVEKAFTSKSFNRDHCHTCLKTGMNFVPCEKCSWEIFCGNNCAKQNDVHQCGESLVGLQQLEQNEFETKRGPVNLALSKADTGELNVNVEFLKHSILESLALFPNTLSLMDFVKDALQPTENNIPDRLDDAKSKYRAFLQLSTKSAYADRIEPFREQTFVTFKYLLLRQDIQNRFGTEQRKRFLMHLLVHHGCILAFNGCDTHDGRSNAFILISYLNHACAPNLRTITLGNIRYGITLRPIKAGQQLFISYLSDIPGQISVEDTQRRLQQDFGFQCSGCERCKLNKSLWWTNSELMQNDEDFLFIAKPKQWMETNDGRSEKEKYRILKDTALALLHKYGGGHWCEELAHTMALYGNLSYKL